MSNNPSVTGKHIPVKKSNLAGLLAFGETNLAPQNLLTVIGSSVTASACLSARAQFIEGNGFRDKNIWKMVVHRSGLTLDRCLNRTSWNVGFLEVISMHVGYNALGKIAFIRPIPADYIRLAEPDDYGVITHAAICPYLDDQYNKSKKTKFTKLHLFNPDPEIVQQQIIEAGGIEQYQGQIAYEMMWNPGDGYYHEPSYLSCFNDMQSEGQLSIYDWKTINNGFNVSAIISVLAKELREGQNYDPYLDDNSLEAQIAQNQGAQNAARLMVYRAQSQAELDSFKVSQTAGQELANRYISTAERVENRITRAWNVPNEIVNIRRQGGIAPTGDEVKVGSQLMYQNVNRQQRLISEFFTIVLRNWKEPVILDEEAPCAIENLNYFPEGWNGDAPKPVNKPTEQNPEPQNV